MKIFRILAFVCLSSLLLVGCSSNSDSSSHNDKKSHTTTDQNNHTATKNKNAASDKNSTNNHKKGDRSTASKGGRTSNQGSAAKKSETNGNKRVSHHRTGKKNDRNDGNIADQLKMKNTNIKIPTNFPVNGSVTATITKNKPSIYSISYQTKSNKDVASFTGTLYKSINAANSDLDEFMNGKAVPKNKIGEKDLGHGIKGYSEGTAGHAHFGWKEGNWALAIRSVSADEMNNPAIARKMVDYLESHSLPAPKNTGMVFVNYPKGGNSVNVNIRWQENKMVYQLTTSKVPLDALKMATSVK